MNKQDADIEKQLNSILRHLLSELGSPQALIPITPHTSFEKDLGLDSLGRVEFFRRVEQAFNACLPEKVIANTDNILDLIKVLKHQSVPESYQQEGFIPKFESAHVQLNNTQTLIDVLNEYNEHAPDRPHIYLKEESGLKLITYGKLYVKSYAIAEGLAALGLKQYDTVAIMLPTCEEFFYIFFGILLAGGIPVPIYPPFRMDRISEYAIRESAILKNAQVRMLVTFTQAEVVGKLLKVFIPSLQHVVTYDDILLDRKRIKVDVQAHNAALIQYTSGSTAEPKGVLLNHANLLANMRAYGDAIQITSHDIGISWLPLYHDMGLIGAWFGSLYHAMPTFIMSPLSFLSHPASWLWAIHYHRATLTAGPNFAYELCVNKINSKEIEGLDLSSLRIAFNGAEAVKPDTLRRFIKKFQPYGFKPEALYPVYGLAETSVALTFPKLGHEARVDRINREEFELHNQAIPTKAQDEKSMMEFVSCGPPLQDHELRVVNENNEPLADRRVGFLQFCGPSSMQGYYRNPEATKKVYHNGWWGTGDMAYVADGELFITGRQKDLIIKAGRNLYPEGIEETAGDIKGVRKGCVCALGVFDEKQGTEKLVIIAETRETNARTQKNIIKEISEKIISAHTIAADDIVLVPPHSVHKTSSGKLRRSSCKQDYIKGKIYHHKPSKRLQILSLFFMSASRKTASFIRSIFLTIYTLYFIFIFSLGYIALKLSLIITKQPKKARRIARFWCRFFFILVGCPIKVINKSLLAHDEPTVFVVNHSGYLDALVLLATLSDDVCIIVKQELSTSFLLRGFIKQLDYITVERWEFLKSVEDAKKVMTRLEQHESMAFFPEGTFIAAPGILPFKLGAFKAAVEKMRPVCPLVIKGTRYIMREGRYLMRPKVIHLIAGEAIKPRNSEWTEIIRLRDQARQFIARESGQEILNL